MFLAEDIVLLSVYLFSSLLRNILSVIDVVDSEINKKAFEMKFTIFLNLPVVFQWIRRCLLCLKKTFCAFIRFFWVGNCDW